MTISMVAAIFAVCLSADRLFGGQKTCRWMPVAGFDDPSMASYSGTYANSEYKYKVSIPNGLIGHSSTPPAPNHGFGILLGQRGDGYVSVDGSWNSLEYESSERAARSEIGYLNKQGAIILQSKTNPSKLAEMQATHLIVWYRCADSNQIFVNEKVIALSADRSLIWVLGLDTKQSRFQKDRRVFESILKSWEHNPRPERLGR